MQNSYDWGKLGNESKVAAMARANAASKATTSTTSAAHDIVDDTKPYAELWLGTHPNGPSMLMQQQQQQQQQAIDMQPLKAHVSAATISARVFDRYRDLPFLLKVLSIRKALSIQAHPDKTLARALHAQRPDVYKDPNHKPEMVGLFVAFSNTLAHNVLK
jgi:mannose-6-phosphate isomerase